MKAQFRNIRLKKLTNAKLTPKQSKKGKKKTEKPEPQWVWLQKDGQPEDRVFFRKEFETQGVAAARLYAVCDDRMTIFVDGKQIVEHNSWEQPVFVDLTKHIDLESPDQKHVLAVQAENGSSSAGLLVKVDLESGWRDATSVVTDGTWQASTTPAKGWKEIGFKQKWSAPEVIAPLGQGPWGKKINATTLAAAAPLKEPTATPITDMKIAKDFEVELLYSVPKDVEGSWVNLCSDPKGRLIVSDQYGGLFRVTPPPVGTAGEVAIEKINVDIGEAQGLLWAFDSLYVVVNRTGQYDSGVYRVFDKDGDDQLDTLQTLRTFEGSSGEHGPHAVLLAPDGESLFIVCGNKTAPTEVTSSRVPQIFDEDLLLPRPYGRGFMKGTRAPGGVIYRINPDGTEWEMVASGFRNEFDAALNADGDLFTYDADMEWDVNTPWYRPTRVCHVASGGEFGWRNGGGKWPVHYPDSLPPVIDIGFGSPTGVCFGYNAKFPAKYQNALFISDWSYGKLYAVHLAPAGSTYTAQLEEFITGTPLPLTDVVINPHDHAMYFTIGGRKVQSGLYRVTYSGSESTVPADAHQVEGKSARAIRHKLEALHVGDHPDAVEIAWKHLGADDRFIRFAARVAIEHRPLGEWRDRALAETNPQASLTALLALARKHERADKGKEPDIDTPPPVWNSTTETEMNATLAAILEALDRLEWADLSVQQQIEALRVCGVSFLRLGPPDDDARREIIDRLDPVYTTKSQALNAELVQMLVYLQAPNAASKIVAALERAPTQEEQIDLAKSLRHLRAGWTAELQRQYFTWFTKAAGYRGGASFSLFVDNIKQDAVALLNEEDQLALKPILEAMPPTDVPQPAPPRPFVREWKMEELVPLVTGGLKGRDFDRGRELFGAANCFACHRFDNQGGAVGPDLTILSGRFSARDILESVVEPSKVISDQYAAVTIFTQDGKVITGRIVNLAGDAFRVSENMLDPGNLTSVDRKQIEEMVPAKVSMMPQGLLNTLDEEEVLDLMAYLLSRGDRNNEMFQASGD
ncbi:MAG: c-type cytochrome [Planctomycetales bacterium]|nr:c-type cytochrome [Planctomycetales bacterium]